MQNLRKTITLLKTKYFLILKSLSLFYNIYRLWQVYSIKHLASFKFVSRVKILTIFVKSSTVNSLTKRRKKLLIFSKLDLLSSSECGCTSFSHFSSAPFFCFAQIIFFVDLLYLGSIIDARSRIYKTTTLLLY